MFTIIDSRGDKMCEWLRTRWRWWGRLILLATIPFVTGFTTPNSIDTGELRTGANSLWVAAYGCEGQYVPDCDQYIDCPQSTCWTWSGLLFLVVIAFCFFWLGRLTAKPDRPSKDDIEKGISGVFDARRKEAIIHNGPNILQVALDEAETEVKKKLKGLKLL